MSRTRSLYLVAALCGAAGVMLRLAPAGVPLPVAGAVPATGTSPARPTPMAAAPSLDGAGAYDEIIVSNVFSSTRAAPTARFVPEGLRKDTGAAAPRAKPAAAPIRLYGITRGAEGAVALIDADPDIPGAEVYRVGDQVRGARISAITDSTVVLGRPSGSVVLRLPVTEGDGR